MFQLFIDYFILNMIESKQNRDYKKGWRKMNNVFDIDSFKVKEDENYYYFFRALNREDNKDLEEGKITENGKIIKIRTDTQRWKESNKGLKPRYDEDTKNSLEQMYDHIKPKFCRCTNCISLSCDAGVTIHYGKDFYNDTYIMVKVQKEEIEHKVINAGLYLLNHIEAAVNTQIDLLKDEVLKKKLNQINYVNNSKDIANIVIMEYNLNNKVQKRFKGLKPKMEDLYPLKNRFGNYNTLNKQQTFEKNKLFAKITLLEKYNSICSIIKTTKNNINLLRTVDNAFASLEFIHYGQINENEIIEISRKEMDTFNK